ncbi:MAG: response regulator [Candidatus Zixiibacteriota bacterium]
MKQTGSILIVDDAEFIRSIIARMVKREGYTVSEACDGVEALEKLAVAPVDFVISDIKMPRMDGLELLGEIKSNYPDVMVLMITGYAGEYTSDDVLAAGADYFITKPFKNVEIARTLVALKTKQQQQKAKAARAAAKK